MQNTESFSRLQKASSILPYWEETDNPIYGKTSAMQVTVVSLVTSGRRIFSPSWTEPRQSTENKKQSKEAVAESRRQKVAELPCLWIGWYNTRQLPCWRSPATSQKQHVEADLP